MGVTLKSEVGESSRQSYVYYFIPFKNGSSVLSVLKTEQLSMTKELGKHFGLYFWLNLSIYMCWYRDACENFGLQNVSKFHFQPAVAVLIGTVTRLPN